MQEDKNQIVSGILRARSELEEVLNELEKLPPVSESSVHFAAHALSNYLTVAGGTVELLQLMLAEHPDPKVRTGLEALQRATSLMLHTVSQLVNAQTDQDAEMRFEKVEMPLMAQRFRIYYQRIANQKQIQCLAGSTVDVPPVWTDRVATAAALDNLFSNAVKDSHRTKTGPETRRTLSLIWGTTALPERAAASEAWYHSLLRARDAVVRPVWP